MMDLMRPADSQQILIIGFERFESVMDKPIVKDKVDGSINTDPRAYPKAII